MASSRWSHGVACLAAVLVAVAGPLIPRHADAATAESPSPVEASLLAAVDAPKPGQRFSIGVLLTTRPGWHTYWINPGDSGLATRVRFTAPKGFEVGPLRWPAPQAFDQPGGFVCYGYSGTVLLTASVATPPDWAGGDASFTADVSWLCCEKVCLPGSAKLALHLPSAGSPDLFKTWSERIPRPLGATDRQAMVVTRVGERISRYELPLVLPAGASELHFFPDADEAVKVGPGVIEQVKDRVTLRFSAELLAGQSPTRRENRGVLTFRRADGVMTGLEFDFPSPGPVAAATQPARRAAP